MTRSSGVFLCDSEDCTQFSAPQYGEVMDILKPVQQKPPGWLREAEHVATQTYKDSEKTGFVPPEGEGWKEILDLISVYNYPLKGHAATRQRQQEYWAQEILIR